MSYLTKADGVPDFSKAVISFWFRVQSECIERVADEVSPGPHTPLMNVIPLCVFGQQFNGYDITSAPAPTRIQTETVKSFFSGTEFFVTTREHVVANGAPTLSQGEQFDEAPSYIGMFCYRDSDTGETRATLLIRFQTKDFGNGSWVSQVRSEHTSDFTSYAVADATAPVGNAYDSAVGACVDKPDAGAPEVTTGSPVDKSEIYVRQHGPDSFEVGPVFADNPHEFMKVEPDEWHHLLISFDLSRQTKGEGMTVFDAHHCSPTPTRTLNEIKAIADPCQIWIALDDENRNGKALDDPRWSGRPDRRTVDGLGDNGIAPYYAMHTAMFASSGGSSGNFWKITGARHVDNIVMGGMPTYTYVPSEDGALPTNGQPFGIPGTPAMQERIRHVEMAEFQMFLGKTLDTAVEANRRAFIDFVRDDEGNPVVDEDGKRTMLPVLPRGTEEDPVPPAERLLAKEPEILLHKTSNWQRGVNTGSEPEDLDPTGRIDRYKPDPFLKKIP